MIRVAVAARATRRASAGMRAYANAVVERVPRVAPDVAIVHVHAPTLGLPFALRRAHADLVHLPYFEMPPFVPRPYTAMVHDAIHLRFPHLFARATAAYWRLHAIPTYRGAARVLVSDPRVADDCVTLLGIDRARIRIVPLGYDAALLTTTAFEAPRPYVFYAGNHKPHKELRTLYAAWAALPDDLVLDLVVTGVDEPAVRARYARRGGEIRFIGELGTAALGERYRGAVAYVQPSLAEGFGLPALEAAVCGAPVIATRESVPAVVAPYAQTFTAGDVAALRALLLAVARDPARARERAAEGAGAVRAYTWDQFAASTAAVFREVVCS
ncbi:MAG TPA: glycosyltransferase [Candidatus Baltobacteraceae bacterium]|nr:glycosyltransferase [Candidatus Baltobacteraceae bacterium]